MRRGETHRFFPCLTVLEDRTLPSLTLNSWTGSLTALAGDNYQQLVGTGTTITQTSSSNPANVAASFSESGASVSTRGSASLVAADSSLTLTVSSQADEQGSGAGLFNDGLLHANTNGQFQGYFALSTLSDVTWTASVQGSNSLQGSSNGSAQLVINLGSGDITLNAEGPATQSQSGDVQLPAGTHYIAFSISAGATIYGPNINGSPMFPPTGPANASVNFTLTASPLQLATTTTVSAPSPSTYGQAVTFSATVTNTTSSATPTGSVEFFDGATDLGPGTALSGSGGSATSTFTTSALAKGSHAISAVYTPTGSFTGSSGGATQTVNPYAFTYQIANDTQTYGSPVNLAADLGTAINTGVNGETLGITYTSSGDTQKAHVGTYDITAVLSNGTGLLSNYSVTLKSGQLTVNRYAFTYQIVNDTQTYGNPVNLAADLGTTINTGVNGETLGITYSSAGNAPTANVGTYDITAVLSNGTGLLSDYNVTLKSGQLAVNPALLTVTADNQVRFYGQANPPLTVTFTGFVNGQALATSGVTGNPSLSTPATTGSAPGYYPIIVGPGTLAATNYTFTFQNGTLTVTPAPLSAAKVNFAATAGASFIGAVATFINADPFGSAASYTAVITWGDGSTSAGTISGTGSTLTVSGSHTYADPVNETVHVTISHKLGYTTTATVSDTATVTSLGLGVEKGLTGGIGFWHNSQGQALISSFNGGSASTALSAWLSATFPNLYGASAGSHNLTGKTNAQVAAFFQSLFSLPSPQADAQVLAVALNVYATTNSLGGTAAAAYGFTVSATGLGARSYSVGKDGAAFGVANNTSLNVYELLLAVNKKAVNGVLYNGDTTLQAQAADLFNALNQAGTVG